LCLDKNVKNRYNDSRIGACKDEKENNRRGGGSPYRIKEF